MNTKISLTILLLLLSGCTNNAMRQPEPIAHFEGIGEAITVTHREFVTLRTGQVCEVKDTKIVACERNSFRYAESKADLNQMIEAEEANNED